MFRNLKLKQKNGFLMEKACNYMEQDSTKNCLALVKNNRVSKYLLSVQQLCYPQHKYKGSSKKYYPVKSETSQILKIKETN